MVVIHTLFLFLLDLRLFAYSVVEEIIGEGGILRVSKRWYTTDGSLAYKYYEKSVNEIISHHI